jgi:hypothetical protein
MTNRLFELRAYGQSVWFDGISRRIVRGEQRRAEVPLRPKPSAQRLAGNIHLQLHTPARQVHQVEGGPECR